MLKHPNEQKDRRRFTRFTPKNGTMAVNSHALGPIINISMGGLSFRYMDGANTTPVTDVFGIFLGSDDVLIDKIKSRVVADRLITEGSPFMQTKTRQRSIQFIDLNSDQQKKLENFILTKTQGVA